VACAVGPSVVTTSSTDFSFQDLVFFGIYLNFSVAEITLKNQYLPHSESKSYQIKPIKNPAHQDLSNNTKGKFQFLCNFQLQF
jgi:hypothetical protein